MGAQSQLLGRFVIPLVSLGLVLGAVVFWALFNQQQRALEREYANRVEITAKELAANVQRYSTATEAVEHVYRGLSDSLNLQALHIVELSRSVVIASTEDTTASELPVFGGEARWTDDQLVSFAVPLAVSAYSFPDAPGRDVSAVVTIDAGELLGHHRQQLMTLMGISLVSALALIVGVLMLFRRLVLEPVGRIQNAVQRVEASGQWRMPIMRDDEIGRLSRILERNVRRLADQQAFTQSMFDSLSGIAYRADAKSGEILLSSGDLSAQFGSDPNHEDLFGGDATEAFASFQASVASGSQWNVEHYVEETSMWIEHRGRAIYGRNGRPTFYDGLILDVSERKRSEDQIWLMSEAIRGSSNEVYIIDAQTLACQFANKAALDNLGYTAEEIVSMSVPDIAPTIRDSDVVSAMTDQLTADNELHYRYNHIRKDGSQYPFEFTAIATNSSGSPRLIVLGSDVSERQAAEDAIRQSEERLSLALEGANYGIFDYNGESSTVYLSESVRDWLNLALDEAVTFSKVVSSVNAQDMQLLESQLTSRESDSAEFSVEVRLLETDMQPGRWLHLRGHADFESSGSLRRISGFASDVTRRKDAEDQLQKTVDRFEAVLEHVDEGIVTLTADGRITAANRAFVEMFRSDKEFVIGSNFAKWCGVGVDEFVDGEAKDTAGVRVDGWKFPCEYAVRTMSDLSEDRYAVVVRDTSAQRKAEAELRAAMEQAQAATKAKGEFLATMSHEIRTPMNGVLGMTQLLMDMNLSEEQKDTAQVIFSSGESLLSIINDILDFSKIEAGKLELEQANFDMAVAIREVMELLAGSAKHKQIDLYVDYPQGLPRHFVGDVGRVRQVLMNLVGNAIKFTEEGHVLVSVESIDGASLTVRVRDTGPGLAKEVQPKLFNSFTQGDASTTRKFGGTGLGLAICRQLVNLMGGDIGVYSEPGDGAEFWFSVALTLGEEVEEDPEEAASLAGVRMLVVDDNPIGRDILDRMLGGIGAICATADSGQSALDQLESEHFDLVILDLHMPEMDGIEVVDRIRANPRLKGLKIVILSSSDVASSVGVVSALKPVMRDSVIKLCRRVLSEDSESFIASAEQTDGEQQVLRRLRVLLAEDNAVNQKVAVRMLEKIGCTVDVAANGEEAVQMWKQFPYAMIFMDCQMPELDGLEATRRIRSQESDDHVPIVAMTANAMESDRDACLAAGMDDYASKPVKLNQLDELVSRYGEVRQSP